MIRKSERIAIVTVTYNRRPYCERTLSSLLSFDTDQFDLFVYDNGSSDSTPEYLHALEQQFPNITVVYGTQNLGATEAVKLLLRDYVFDQGYAFIGKNDDDELLPADWLEVFHWWREIERSGAILAGFKRKCTDDYFNGLGWVSRYHDKTKPLYIGDFECYRSYIVPGFQFSSEEWWKVLYPHLSDYGYKFGGWDTSLAMAIRDLQKYCLVIYNRESIHFQRWGDHPEYTRFKFDQIAKVRQTVFELREQGVLQ